MKKFILAVSLLLTLGAGCLGQGSNSPKTVEGNWFVSFDLPSGWVMVKPYEDPEDRVITPSQSVDTSNNDIFIQNTDKAILVSSVAPTEAVPGDSYVRLADGYVRLEVTRLDPRRLIPDEAEALGNSYYKLKVCDDGGACQANGRYNYEYYLKSETANFKFVVYANQDQLELAEKIILSGQMVTNPVISE